LPLPPAVGLAGIDWLISAYCLSSYPFIPLAGMKLKNPGRILRPIVITAASGDNDIFILIIVRASRMMRGVRGLVVDSAIGTL
jgi:hypothetical protein